MSIKVDRWIKEMAETQGMIEPFDSSQVAEGTISYGLSSYGYDLRLADEFKIVTPPRDVVLNPKAITSEYYRDYRGDFCDIPPNGYVLCFFSSRRRHTRFDCDWSSDVCSSD